MILLDALAEVACSKLQQEDPEPRPREPAGLARASARSGAFRQPLAEAVAASSRKLQGTSASAPRDLATLAWASARSRLRGEAFLAGAWKSRLQSHRWSPMDSANLAWALSAAQHVDRQAMSTAVERVSARAQSLDARQPASIAQACARQTPSGASQMRYLMQVTVSQIDALPAQQVGWLADACQVFPLFLGSQSCEVIRAKLSELTQQLGEPLTRLASSHSKPPRGSHSGPLGDFGAMAKRLGADQLGDLGSRELLRSQNIAVTAGPGPSLPREAPGREISGTGKLPPITALCQATLGGRQLSQSAVSGVSDGLRAQRWLFPVPLAVGSVERSLCAEFQVLAQTCDVIFEDLSDSSEGQRVSGKVQLFISAPPCLSCVAAICQFQLLLPCVELEVSWISESQRLEQPQPSRARLSGPGPGLADARSLGNKAVTSQQYALAAEFYCLGLQSPETETLATLLSNRCQGVLHLPNRLMAALARTLLLSFVLIQTAASNRAQAGASSQTAFLAPSRGSDIAVVCAISVFLLIAVVLGALLFLRRGSAGSDTEAKRRSLQAATSEIDYGALGKGPAPAEASLSLVAQEAPEEVKEEAPLLKEEPREEPSLSRSLVENSNDGKLSAQQTAVAKMAQDEFELSEVRLITEDQLPPLDDRIYPRPSLIKYKWVLCTCFEHDWKILRPKLLRNFFSSEEECEVMEHALFRKYRWVMPLYRKLSSEDCNDRGSVPEDISVFGVSKRSAAALLGHEGIDILDKDFAQAQVGNIYTQSNVTRPEETEGFQVTCRQQLARYQFAEFLLRVAHTKWPRLTKAEALDCLFKELAVLCVKYSSDIRTLLNCGSDDVVQDTFVKIHGTTRALFDETASVHEMKYGEKLMTLEDWRLLLNKASVFEHFPVIKRREVGYTYRMGLEARADEQYNKTWQLLRYEDFQRALGAVIFLNEIRSKPNEECLPSTLASKLETFANENLSSLAGQETARRLREIAHCAGAIERLTSLKTGVGACPPFLARGTPCEVPLNRSCTPVQTFMTKALEHSIFMCSARGKCQAGPLSWQKRSICVQCQKGRDALLKMRDYDAAAADAALALQLRAHDAKAWSRYVMAAGGLAALSVAGRGEEYSAGPEKAEIAEVLVEDWRLVTCRAATCSTAFAAAGPGTSPVAPNAVAAKRAIEVAKEAANAEYNKQNYSAAVEGYTKATASDPCLADVAAIFSNLAHCRLCLGQPHCAIASAVSCLRLRPSWAVAVKAVHRLAAALASTGEHDAARQVIRTFDSAVVDDVPEAVRKSCADLCSKLDRHAETLAELTASQGQPDHWESLLEGLLPGSEWCSGSLEASGGRLRVRSPTPRGSLLLLLRPLGGLAQGSDSWSHGELARHYVRSDGWGLHERLSSICNTDVAAKEVALLITGALGRVADPRELMLSSPRAQLLPLLGQRLESFFRSFGTLSPSLLGCLLEEHRVTLQPNPPGAGSSRGIFPTLALIPEANSETTANCEMRFKQNALTVLASEDLEPGKELRIETSATPHYVCQKRCKEAQAALEEAASRMMTSSKDEVDALTSQYAAGLRDFQAARAEREKLSAEAHAPTPAALAAVRPYFEAEDEHREQLAEEELQEEKLRQNVAQAKLRYHSELRSLEALSNQAHLRRASSGYVDAVSRTASGTENPAMERTASQSSARRTPVQTPEQRPAATFGRSLRKGPLESQRHQKDPSAGTTKQLEGSISQQPKKDVLEELPAPMQSHGSPNRAGAKFMLWRHDALGLQAVPAVLGPLQGALGGEPWAAPRRPETAMVRLGIVYLPKWVVIHNPGLFLLYWFLVLFTWLVFLWRFVELEQYAIQSPVKGVATMLPFASGLSATEASAAMDADRSKPFCSQPSAFGYTFHDGGQSFNYTDIHCTHLCHEASGMDKACMNEAEMSMDSPSGTFIPTFFSDLMMHNLHDVADPSYYYVPGIESMKLTFSHNYYAVRPDDLIAGPRETLVGSSDGAATSGAPVTTVVMNHSGSILRRFEPGELISLTVAEVLMAGKAEEFGDDDSRLLLDGRYYNFEERVMREESANGPQGPPLRLTGADITIKISYTNKGYCRMEKDSPRLWVPNTPNSQVACVTVRAKRGWTQKDRNAVFNEDGAFWTRTYHGLKISFESSGVFSSFDSFALFESLTILFIWLQVPSLIIYVMAAFMLGTLSKVYSSVMHQEGGLIGTTAGIAARLLNYLWSLWPSRMKRYVLGLGTMEIVGASCVVALVMMAVTYHVAIVARRYVHTDPASYAQNMSEILSTIGYASLVYQLHWPAHFAASISCLSLQLGFVSSGLELVGFALHPHPYDCYVPDRGVLGGTVLFLALTASQVVLTLWASVQLQRWRKVAAADDSQEMPWRMVLLIVGILFGLSMLSKGDCGSPLGDAVWSAAYAIDDIVMVPQIWLVAKRKEVPMPLATLVLFTWLATLIELLADFIGMQSKLLAGSQFASNCFMYAWNDFLSLAISADFAYWYVYSLICYDSGVNLLKVGGRQKPPSDAIAAKSCLLGSDAQIHTKPIADNGVVVYLYNNSAEESIAEDSSTYNDLRDDQGVTKQRMLRRFNYILAHEEDLDENEREKFVDFVYKSILSTGGMDAKTSHCDMLSFCTACASGEPLSFEILQAFFNRKKRVGLVERVFQDRSISAIQSVTESQLDITDSGDAEPLKDAAAPFGGPASQSGSGSRLGEIFAENTRMQERCAEVTESLKETLKVASSVTEEDATTRLEIYRDEVQKIGKSTKMSAQTLADGSIYEGEWVGPVRHGRGVLKLPDGSSYSGQFEHGVVHGFAAYTLPTGAKYEGEWRLGKQDGEGREITAEGAIYQGQYKDGKKEGHARISYPDGSSFEGQVSDGKLHGKGKYVWSNGHCYEGDWQDDMMHGDGVYTWPTGVKFVGQYQNNLKH
ncbi:PIP5K9, partial [Symbiodinium microadriaticum]